MARQTGALSVRRRTDLRRSARLPSVHAYDSARLHPRRQCHARRHLRMVAGAARASAFGWQARTAHRGVGKSARLRPRRVFRQNAGRVHDGRQIRRAGHRRRDPGPGQHGPGGSHLELPARRGKALQAASPLRPVYAADVHRRRRSPGRACAGRRGQNPLRLAQLRRPYKVLVDSLDAWMAQRAGSKGAALAFYTLFSMTPILVLAIALAGYFFGAEAARGEIIVQMQALAGVNGAQAIQALLAAAQDPAAGLVATLVASMLLLLGASSVFAELKGSLD